MSGPRRRHAATLRGGQTRAEPHPTLSEFIARELRSAIEQGELEPGTRLREVALALRFGTSQAPVREALRQLERDGLVDYHRRRGVYVRRLSVRDIDEIYSVRAALESLAMRRAVFYAQPGQLERLSELMDAMTEAADAGDNLGVAETTLSLHEEIVLAARNARLLESWRAIIAQTRFYARVHARYQTRLDADVRSHRALVDALHRRDPDAAEAEAKRHVSEARHDFLGYVLQHGIVDEPDSDARVSTPVDDWAVLS